MHAAGVTEARPIDPQTRAVRLPPRSPRAAALLSLLLPGGGQLYNHQLDKAVLIWIWMLILAMSGSVLALLGWLGPRAPLGEWVALHGGLLDRKSTRLNSSHGYISY